ncbi:hypothetical protein ACFQ2M_37625 [Kitasatospora saccharophila]|uniref:hypothetical protein n=1 Tax=Kitasatospora saccharophila TaxID=407973 RepID=UPI0036263000
MGEGRAVRPDGGTEGAAPEEVSPERVTALLARLAGMLLAASGEGASEVEQTVAQAAAGFGARTSMVLVPDGATLTVVLDGRTSTVAVRAFPDVARLDKVAALKPWAHRVSLGRTPSRRPSGGWRRSTARPPPTRGGSRAWASCCSRWVSRR